jgi:DNA polymerase III subunit epsilon
VRNSEFHGIVTADLAGAPAWEHITPTLLSLLSGSVLVCHNAAFDFGFLAEEGYLITRAPPALRRDWA